MESLRKLLPFIKPYRFTVLMALLLGLGLSGMGILTAKLVKIITDELLVAKNMDVVYRVASYAVAIYLIGGVMRFTHMYLLRYTGDRISVDIRNLLQKKYANQSLTFHSDFPSGALISRTTNDVNWVQLGLTLFADVVREPINALVLVSYLLYTNWQLTLLLLLIVPILTLTSKSLGRSVRRYSHLMQTVNEKLIGILKETLDGIRIVKAFRLENDQVQKYEKANEEFLYSRRKILGREELAGPVSELVAAIAFSGVLFFAGYQIVSGQATAGDFTSFIFALGLFQQPIKKLQDAHVKLQHTVTASKRVFELLDYPQSVQDPLAPKPWPQSWQDIRFEDLHFSYRENHVLKGLNLSVSRGEMLALVGPSGSGKSTLVNLLLRFFDPTSGKITIGGVDLRDLTQSELRSHLALVTQDVFLFNDSIAANVAGNESIDEERVKRCLKDAYILDYIESLPQGIWTVVGERGGKLSGGERQRVSIARALYKNAPILILDEATSSLDSQSESFVQKALDRLMEGRTTFVIAHRLSTVKQADRIVVLSDGRIAEEGRHSELITRDSGLYKNLHEIQYSS